jgi:hypothetical protein
MYFHAWAVKKRRLSRYYTGKVSTLGRSVYYFSAASFYRRREQHQGTLPVVSTDHRSIFIHLTPGQRAAVAVEAKPLLEVEAKKNQSAAGNPLGRAKQSAVLKNEKTTPVHAEKTVAKQFDVSQGYVYAAQKIKDKDDPAYFFSPCRAFPAENRIPYRMSALEPYAVKRQGSVSASPRRGIGEWSFSR